MLQAVVAKYTQQQGRGRRRQPPRRHRCCRATLECGSAAPPSRKRIRSNSYDHRRAVQRPDGVLVRRYLRSRTPSSFPRHLCCRHLSKGSKNTRTACSEPSLHTTPPTAAAPMPAQKRMPPPPTLAPPRPLPLTRPLPPPTTEPADRRRGPIWRRTAPPGSKSTTTPTMIQWISTATAS